MNSGFDKEYNNRLLGEGSEEQPDEFELETAKEDESDEYYELPPAIRSRTLLWSVISFTLGILSLALCGFYYVSFVLAAFAVGFAMFSRKNLGFFERYSIMGLVFGIMGFVFSIFSLVANSIGLFS